MWFDVQKALAEIEGRDMPLSTAPGIAPPDIRPRVAVVASVATGKVQMPENSPPANLPEQVFPYGKTVGNRPLTYTGRVVSLEVWRSLTEWERHGPDGRHWCGIAQAWITPKGKDDGK